MHTKHSLTQHCVERYIERVQPSLTADQARLHLANIAASTEFIREAPGWVTVLQDFSCTGYLMLGPDICIPVVDSESNSVRSRLWITVLVRGSLHPNERKRRNHQRKRHTRKIAPGRGLPRPQITGTTDLDEQLES